MCQKLRACHSSCKGGTSHRLCHDLNQPAGLSGSFLHTNYTVDQEILKFLLVPYDDKS